MPHMPQAAPTLADELATLRRELSGAIMAEDWEAVRFLNARIRELDESLAYKVEDVPDMVADGCRRHGTKAVSDLLGYSRQAVLACAARVQSNGAVLFGIQQRVYLLKTLDEAAERRAADVAKRDAAADEQADAKAGKRNGRP